VITTNHTLSDMDERLRTRLSDKKASRVCEIGARVTPQVEHRAAPRPRTTRTRQN
jgi:hypothetical protein